MSLSVRRVVENGAQIFRSVDADDATGLRHLFDMGLGSPDDSYLTGVTALWVCTISILLNSEVLGA